MFQQALFDEIQKLAAKKVISGGKVERVVNTNLLKDRLRWKEMAAPKPAKVSEVQSVDKQVGQLSKPLTKMADLRLGDPKHPVTSLGIFLHADEGKERKVHKEWMGLISKHRSPIKALTAYTKRHPNTFTTALVKHEPPPGMLSFRQKALYADKVKNPRLFVRIGPAGSHSQQAMYHEAMRGLYDDELHHAPKGQRHVYG